MKLFGKAVCGAAIMMSATASAPVPRGRPAAVDVSNQSDVALECHAIAGHWYGLDLGTVAPGGRLMLHVLFDPPSGMIAVPNDRDRLVPLQYVYCGQVGDAWASRAVLPLRPLLEHLGAQIGQISCRRHVDGLRCEK